MASRTILHVDLDAFYASVEQRDDPSLRGRPVIVGGHARRGVVCAASYEARPFGVKSAMPMAQALKLCPHAVVLPPRMDHYATVSQRFFDILTSFTPLVEGLSLDEAFLDVTAVGALFGDGPTIASIIKARVRDELALVASVGVAPSKFIAKIASDLRKPDGLVVVSDGEITPFLHPLPVSRLWGVGQVTGHALAQLGIATIGDVAGTPLGFLQARLGRALGAHLHALALGHDDRAVEPDHAPVSIGHEDTFDADVFSRSTLVVHLLDQGDRVATRLRRSGLRARVITLKVKYGDHMRVSRRQTLPRATADGREIGQALKSLLARVPDIETRGVRLTGLSASGFEDERAPTAKADQPATQQLSFAALAAPAPAATPAGERLGQVLDTIRSRWGSDAVKRAIHLEEDEQDGPSARGRRISLTPDDSSTTKGAYQPRSRR